MTNKQNTSTSTSNVYQFKHYQKLRRTTPSPRTNLLTSQEREYYYDHVNESKEALSLGLAIAQIGHYIIAKKKEGLIVIDLRIIRNNKILENLKRRYLENKIETYPVFFWGFIEICEEQREILIYHKNELERLGVILYKDTRPQYMTVKELPVSISEHNVEKLISSLADVLKNISLPSFKFNIEKIISVFKSHINTYLAANLSLEEMNKLLRKIEKEWVFHQNINDENPFLLLKQWDIQYIYSRNKAS